MHKFDQSNNWNKKAKNADLGVKGQVLDLSSVCHILNATEPITKDIINAFLNNFCPFGLKENFMYPSYGLAEHTVFVCSHGKQKLHVSKNTLEMDGVVKIISPDKKETSTTKSTQNQHNKCSTLFGCGFLSNQDIDVRIVHPETFEELKEDHVGEIWIHSPSKANGYYNMPKK